MYNFEKSIVYLLILRSTKKIWISQYHIKLTRTFLQSQTEKEANVYEEVTSRGRVRWPMRLDR